MFGSYSLSLFSITLFCTPFLFFQKKIIKKNIFFSLFLLIIFISNYSYGIYKLNASKYNFEKNLFIKIISPNFSLTDYQIRTEEFQLKRLIKVSDPEYAKKTLFIWPEGIFYESYLGEIKKHRKLFENNFSENHLIILGINNFNNSSNTEDKKYFNSLVVLNNKLEILSLYNKINLVPFGEFCLLKKFYLNLD